MGGTPLDSAKKAVTAALAKFTPEDMFNIIAFNGETFPYSSYLKEATTENVESSIQWMDDQFVAGGGTNFLNPLKEVICPSFYIGSEKYMFDGYFLFFIL